MANAAAAINKMPPAASLDKKARKAEFLGGCFIVSIIIIAYGDSTKRWQAKAKNAAIALP
ncbi:hypothetical protein [Sphingorhabdus wooponensis]|jgi:hypothetical protein|uniref:hypothetical protein n=1 Tax=Sphingorhabdus wooponensis TaxID=940136 RepID=UPI001FE6FE99|nr:hypothetical protein [Sphingorhabdus wooponensis]